MQTIGAHDGAIRVVVVAILGPAIRAGRVSHVTFTGDHGLEPEASFDEGGESLIGESAPEFRICEYYAMRNVNLQLPEKKDRLTALARAESRRLFVR